MKRLTINRLASAGIRADWKSYLSLCVGIFTSIFLVCSVVLSIFAGRAGYLDNVQRQMGKQEATVFDVSEESAQKIIAMSDQWGFGTIRGHARSYAIGSYDKAAADLAYRQMYEGRMPEKPGEVAMEPEALGKLAPDAEPGDTISLSILPLDGKRENRDFILTGIVKSQAEITDKHFLTDMLPGVRAYAPQIFVVPEEPPFATGNLIQNLYLTTDRNHSPEDIATAVSSDGILGFTGYGWIYRPGEVFVEGDPVLSYVESVPILTIVGVLGGSLLAFALFGIISALDGQLDRKKEEIGMLRAVGATRRQIREIFGRESWLLALILSPAAIGASTLLEWLLCSLFPTTFCFSLPPLAVVIMAVSSVLFILIASFVPLWRYSRQRPMGMIRDTKSLRRAKHIHTKSSFLPTVLIQRRKLRLHPMRYVTGTVLTALLCVSMLASTIIGRDAVELLILDRLEYDFVIIKSGWTGFSDLRTEISDIRLSDADVDQIRALPHVQSMQGEWDTNVIWQMEELPDYLKQCQDNGVILWCIKPDSDEVTALGQLWNTKDDFCKIGFFVTDHPEALAQFLVDGNIDRAALDTGAEVLFCAPDYYIVRDGVVNQFSLNLPLWEAYDTMIRNDSVFVGQNVHFHQLAADVGQASNNWDGQSEADLRRLYQQADHRQAEARIGGIVKAISGNDRTGLYDPTDPVFITTPQGMTALGLQYSEISNLKIYLDGDVDESTEAYLENRITRIANRGEELYVENEIDANRDNRQSGSTALVICGSILALFLWISVSIISGSVARQMQAEKKTIGTLRALGMEERRLVAGYAGQAAVTILLGLILACPVFVFVKESADLLLGLGGVLLIAVIALLLCRWRIGRIGKKLLRESVIDNIREV